MTDVLASAPIRLRLPPEDLRVWGTWLRVLLVAGSVAWLFGGAIEAMATAICGCTVLGMRATNLGLAARSKRALEGLVVLSFAPAVIAAGLDGPAARWIEALDCAVPPLLCVVMADFTAKAGLTDLAHWWKSLSKWQLAGFVGTAIWGFVVFASVSPAAASVEAAASAGPWVVSFDRSAVHRGLFVVTLAVALVDLVLFVGGPWLLLHSTATRLRLGLGVDHEGAQARREMAAAIRRWRARHRNAIWFIGTLAFGLGAGWLTVSWLEFRRAPLRPPVVKMPAGEFLMGSPQDDPGRNDDEDLHHVSISQDFYLCKTEVTQLQWRAVMGFASQSCNVPCVRVFGDSGACPESCGDDRPVVVSWEQSLLYLNELSEKEGLDKCYELVGGRWEWDRGCDGYRLPTEAEWEYSARVGGQFESDTDWIGNKAWYSRNSGRVIQPVANKEPNAWGLYDMAGNVNEWVWDWYGPYGREPVVDPVGPQRGDARVSRGGAVELIPSGQRAQNRHRDAHPPLTSIGLRCARGAHPVGP